MLALVALVELMQSPQSSEAWLPPLTMAAAGVSLGIFCMPSVYYSFRRMLNPKGVPWRSLRAPSRWLSAVSLTIPFVLIGGTAILRISGAALLLLPILHILAVVLPTVAVALLAMRELPLGSPQRVWGVLCSSLSLTPLLVLIFEGMTLLLVGTASLAYLSLHPEGLERLLELGTALQAPDTNLEQAIELLRPLLRSPVIISLVLLVFSVFVPMIEEFVKPIGVWLLYGRPLSPSAGFALGAISGGGFALVETLALSVEMANWVALIGTRLGTAAIHVMTSALCGWALVQLWTKGRYRRALSAYLSAVLIHGLWNGLVVVIALQTILQPQMAEHAAPLWNRVSLSASFGLITLAVGALVCLSGMNKQLRQERQSHPNKAGTPKDNPPRTVL